MELKASDRAGGVAVSLALLGIHYMELKALTVVARCIVASPGIHYMELKDGVHVAGVRRYHHPGIHYMELKA